MASFGLRSIALGCAALALWACTSGADRAPEDAGADAEVAEAGGGGAPEAGAAIEEPPAPLPPPEPPRCPPEMVRVARRFCVDRYEATLLDARTGKQLSPYYPPSRRKAVGLAKAWEKQRLEMGSEEAQQMPLPPLPDFQRADFEFRAVSKKDVVPQGYVSGEEAALACKNAGKRLCSLEEWRTACRGEQDQPFPYGPTYQQGRCNVFREAHPAQVLHDDLTIGHSDPRLNLVAVKGKPLLRRTGQTASCMSAWEGDAIADMVGNLDEWVDDPEGTFSGGFYARSTKDGCMRIVTSHSIDYFDYSTGIRCCADLAPPPQAR